MSLMLAVLGLYYLCSGAGLLMVVGGIWLIYKQRIYIDRETNQITEIKTPLGSVGPFIPVSSRSKILEEPNILDYNQFAGDQATCSGAIA